MRSGFRVSTEMITLIALAVLPVACSSKAGNTDTVLGADLRENALVRFVNVTAHKEPMDLYLDDTKTSPAVGQDRVTDYQQSLAERHDIELRIAGEAKTLAMNSEKLRGGERYTVVAFNKTDGTSGVAVFRDNVSQPESGKARIRLIHVAAGADELDVAPAGAGSAVLARVDYKSDGSVEVDPRVKSLEIRKEGERNVAAMISDLSLEAGKTYTIVVAADAEHRLRAIPMEPTAPIREGHLRH
jgi:hypothetical protein